MSDANEERRPETWARPTPVDARRSEQEEAGGRRPLPLSVTPSPAFQQLPSQASAVVSFWVHSSTHAATFPEPSSRGRGEHAPPGPASPLERRWLQSPLWTRGPAPRAGASHPALGTEAGWVGCHDPHHGQGRWRRSGRLHGVAPRGRGHCRPNRQSPRKCLDGGPATA